MKRCKRLTGWGRFFTLFVAVMLSIAAIPAFSAKADIALRYGYISAIEITTEKSAIARNSLLGGLVGIAVGDNTYAALHGAAAAFAITSIIEGDRRVFLYTVQFSDGESEGAGEEHSESTQGLRKLTQQIAVHHSGLSLGQCVALEQGNNHANLRPVSAVYCGLNGHPALSGDDVEGRQQQLAHSCKDARQQVRDADNDAAIDSALVTMRALCE
ncbi:MAG: hypothetical protein V7707_09510 [Motiliproteus sp.]